MLADEKGRGELHALGARSVPAVARDGAFVFAQVLSDVVAFLSLEEVSSPVLSAAELAVKYQRILTIAIAYTRQMPDAELGRQLPNRPRSWRVLMHHVFQIPCAFIEAQHKTLTYEMLLAGPPEAMTDSASIAAFGETVANQFTHWWTNAANSDFTRKVSTYFGDTTLHELLERTVWHSTQHVRQVASLLEEVGITPELALDRELLQDLPLTGKLWDEG